MKKILLLVLSLVLCLGLTFGLASCVGGEDNNDGGNETPAVSQDLQDAMDFLWDMYRNSDNAETASNFDRTAVVPVGEVKFAVEWTVDNDAISIVEKDDSTVTIKVPEKPSEAISYKLTATIKDSEGNSVSKTFNHVVPKFRVLTFDEYRATESGKSVVIEGIVAGINSTTNGNTRNHLFLVDESGKGGYYVYDSEHDPIALGIEIGMKVRVSGPLDIYKDSIYEIIDGDGKVMEITIVNSEKVPVTAIDITESFAAGNDLYAYVGALVTIKGVTLGGQELGGKSDYLYFSLNNNQSYVRSYLTDLEASIKSDANKAAIEADHLAHNKYIADVTGLLVYYGTTAYLIPVSTTPFTNYVEPELTDAEKLAAELENVKIKTLYTKDGVVNVAVAGATYTDVKFSYAADNAAVSYADGKLTITVSDTVVNVKITVTATFGELTDSKDIEIVLAKDPVADSTLTVEEVLALGGRYPHNTYTEGKYYVTGVITEVYNTQYGNMYIKDAAGNILTIYGTYSADGSTRYDALDVKPVAGDTVTIYGIVGQFNGTVQIKNGWITSITAGEGGDDVTPPEGGDDPETPAFEGVKPVVGTAYKFGMLQAKAGKTVYITGAMSSFYMATTEDIAAALDVYVEETDGGYYITCTISGAKKYINMIVSGTHVNAVFEDAASTVYTYDETLKTFKAVVNDEEYVFGTRSDNTYLTVGTNKISYDPFYCVFVEAGSGSEGGDDVTPPEGGDDTTTTITNIADALAAADGAAVVLQGIVVSADTWNSSFGNMSVTIKDADGNSIYVFRLATQVGMGDEIIVTGVMGTHNEARQVAQGATAEIVSVHGDNHTYVDGACSICGALEPVEGQTTATVSFADKANRTSYSTSQQIWAQNGITVTNDKGSSTSNVGDFAAPARFYKNSTITIEAEGMTKLIIDVNGIDAKYNTWVSCFSGVAGCTASQVGNSIEVVFDAAVGKVVLTASASQLRANSMTVVVG